MNVGEKKLSQSMAFFDGEGDAWYQRNKHAKLNPVVVQELTKLKCKPKTIVEMGCSSGRYLDVMERQYGGQCIGYDPSKEAIKDGRVLHPGLDLRRGTVRAFYGLPIDILVFGFCLYLVDRDDLFYLVRDADWCLPTGGHLIIHDFDPPQPQVIPYSHRPNVLTYKMDYAALWLANPCYELVSKTKTAEGEAISIIRKGKWDKWRV